ncbi:DUF58 domain-containing protein [Bacillaceae bacterium IKA-2]|nr:DUF58 domain-containing protein [Bacillaceae bacterium IKA-2]
MRKTVKKISPFLKVMMLAMIGITTFVYAMFQGGFVSWFLFYSTFLIIMITIIYASMPIGNLEVKRVLNGERLVAGEDIRVTITIERKFRFPFFYFIVEDVIPNNWELKMNIISKKEIFYPFLEKKLIYSYTIKQPKRGKYEFVKIKVRTSDLFGLFTKEKEVSVYNEMIVFPNYQQLDNVNMYNKNESESFITSKRIIEDITSVAGSREYVAGDRLTSIDWKVTARVNKLMTKEFEEYIGQRYFITIDCSVKQQVDELIFEKAIELAASFVVHSYQKQIHLGLLSIGNQTIHHPVHYGQAHQISLLEQLAKLEIQKGNHFDVAFANEVNKINTDTILILITTRLTDKMIENVKSLKRKRVQVVFCFVNGSEGLTEKQKSKLNIISTINIPYYIIGNDNFSENLRGGEVVAQKS